MDEPERPETDIENLMQQTSEQFAIEENVLAPEAFVRDFLEQDPPDLKQARIRAVTLDSLDPALTRVTFHCVSTSADSALGKLASLGGFDFRAVRGELERWRSACQTAFGGVGPLPEVDRLKRALGPPD